MAQEIARYSPIFLCVFAFWDRIMQIYVPNSIFALLLKEMDFNAHHPEMVFVY